MEVGELNLELKVFFMHESITSSPVKYCSHFLVKDWGRVGYEQSNLDQQALIHEIYEQNRAGEILFCSHDPVVTTGRATQAGDLWGWQGPVFDSPRGGRATYHGPNQLVIYPLVNLRFEQYKVFVKKDVTSYLRLLEKTVIETLQEFAVKAYQRCEKVIVNGEELEATGVWVNEKKVASIGIAVRRWVTYHGIAINVFEDENAFQGINPCGFSNSTMTSMQEVMGQPVNIESLKSVFLQKFSEKFS